VDGEDRLGLEASLRPRKAVAEQGTLFTQPRSEE
jgi:hypothetical protein